MDPVEKTMVVDNSGKLMVTKPRRYFQIAEEI